MIKKFYFESYHNIITNLKVKEQYLINLKDCKFDSNFFSFLISDFIN